MARRRRNHPPGMRARETEQGPPARTTSSKPRGASWRTGALLLALLVATLAVYQPAWNGALLWDDVGHITPPGLRTWDGLRRIWFDLGATQQYYPLLHSAFWLQHRIWGEATLGYHLVNIVLHACSAFLIGLILRRLAIPGAWLAAALFALHPVHVESVAWISELKNTLSGVLCLGAALAYLGFDDDRTTRRYAGALGLFVLALLSKSVTAMLPVVLLVVLWWKRGTLSWRLDVAPLAPFLAIGAVAGLTTAWIEQTAIGARGTDYSFTLVERGLIAGRAIWFYLSALVWPANLVFSYPRWSISASDWRQYLYPLAVTAAVAGAWAFRARSRAPLAVMLAYVAALFPVLGFFNVYPFRYAFVADHFQYLASIPVIALAASGGVWLASRAAPGRGLRIAAMAGMAIVVFALAALTVRESREYTDVTALYEATLRDNPSSVLAHINLGKIIAERGTDLERAVRHFRALADLEPNQPEGFYNMGLAYHRMGRLQDAEASYRSALRVAPTLAEAHARLGGVLQELGRLGDAETSYREALRLKPESPAALASLGFVVASQGQLDDAIRLYREALRLRPEYADAWYYLGNALQSLGRLGEAIESYRRALALNPLDAAAHNNLGVALEAAGRPGEAAAHFQEALRLRPSLTRK